LLQLGTVRCFRRASRIWFSTGKVVDL
jgi:hypothetical protein